MSKVVVNAKPPRVGWGFVRINEKTYVCPGWYEVPNGTTREQIEFKFKMEPVKVVEEVKEETNEWVVEGSKGSQYKVTLKNGRWDCSCPARQFRRGDCKHIKLKKDEHDLQHAL